MKKLLEYAANNKPLIQSHLQKFLDEKIASDKSSVSLYKTSIDKLSDFVVNGKMLRGLLILVTAEMLGDKKDQAINASCAIELIHSGLLIQDDIMDSDEKRRGRKTIYAQFKDEADKSVANSLLYGQSMAICVADIAILLAYEIVSQDKNSEVIKTLSLEIQRVAAAQMLDAKWGFEDSEPQVADILNMYKNKSARYTFSLPLKIGAIISGSNEKLVSQLDLLGEKMGIVFQIVDDSLGVTGDEEVTGKPVGNDIKQNKKTLFRQMLYEKASDEQKEKLNNIFGNINTTNEDIQFVRDLASSLGASSQIEKMTHELSNQARELLEKMDVPANYKELIGELIEYNLSRNS